jgi:predicted unusual protein kinase regulating ubiquinone biosynthesis (AarF/ABC1/UbiB family)
MRSVFRCIIIAWALVFSVSVQAKKVEFPLVLSFHERAVLSYFLAGAGQSETEKHALVERLKAQVTRSMGMLPKKVTVSSFDEFLKTFQGEWPGSYSVQSDLAILEEHGFPPRVTIEAANEETVRQIEEFHQFRREALRRRFGDRLPMLGDAASAVTAAGFLTAGDALTMRIFEQVESVLQSEFEKVGRVGADMADSGRLSGINPEVKAFLEIIFKEYFSRMSIESKAQVLNRLMDGDLNAEPMKKFEILVLSGGPQFQKLLQVVAREGKLSADLLEVFRRLESKANPIPPVLVEKMFEKERRTYRWVSYDKKPLGVGTMAQVHKGKIRTSHGDREVVIRFLKPEIEKRVEEDHRILSAIAPKLDADPVLREHGFPRLTPVVADLTRTVRDELDMNATVERQRQGRDLYSKESLLSVNGYRNDLHISVPEVFVVDPRSKLMVQELVKGDKLDKVVEIYGESLPDLKKAIVEEVARVWVEEVLFRSGFYHADLHQGNFLVDFSELTGVTVNILDFGMGGVVSPEMQKQILLLGAGVEILKASAISRAFLNLSTSLDGISEREFERRVELLVEEMRQGRHPLWTLGRWSAWAGDQGVQFPYEFIGLNRGMVILDKLLEDSKSEIRVSGLSRKIAKRYVRRLWSDLRGTREIGVFDFMKLGWLAATDETAAVEAYEPPPIPRTAVRCEKIFLGVDL